MVGVIPMGPSVPPAAHQLLTYWFGQPSPARVEPAIIERWQNLGALHVAGWRADREADLALGRRFAPWLEQAAQGLRPAWCATARGRLAYVVLCDQLPRAAYRGTAKAYAYDPLALAVTREGLARGDEFSLSAVEGAFLCMPLVHAEDLAAQDAACERFAALGSAAPELRPILGIFQESAIRHRRLIRCFGRFPNRNVALGRVSTLEEQRYLASPWTYFEKDEVS